MYCKQPQTRLPSSWMILKNSCPRSRCCGWCQGADSSSFIQSYCCSPPQKRRKALMILLIDICSLGVWKCKNRLQNLKTCYKILQIGCSQQSLQVFQQRLPLPAITHLECSCGTSRVAQLLSLKRWLFQGWMRPPPPALDDTNFEFHIQRTKQLWRTSRRQRRGVDVWIHMGIIIWS